MVSQEFLQRINYHTSDWLNRDLVKVFKRLKNIKKKCIRLYNIIVQVSLQIVCYLYTWKKWNEKFLLPQNSSPSYILWLLKMTKLDIFLESARKLGVIYVSLGSLIQSFTNVKHGSAEGCAKLWAAEHLKQPSPQWRIWWKLKEKKKCHNMVFKHTLL